MTRLGKSTVQVEKVYICPECRGKTRQFQPEPGAAGRPVKTMNTVRVDHHDDCARWNYIVRRWPKLVGMRKIAIPVI